MSVERMNIETPEGSMPTVIARPPEGRSPINVLLFMDAMGIREELIDFAERFAAAGYTCVLPDLYYRWGEGISFDASVSYHELPADVQEVFYTFVARMRDDKPVVRDGILLVESLTAGLGDPSARWAAVGYCMGGRFAMRMLAAAPERFRAGISAYGTALATDKPDSPHHDLGKIKGEVYLAFGADDELIPPTMIEVVRHELETNEVIHEIQVFPGSGHAFMMPGKASSYRHDEAEEVWRKGFALLDRAARQEQIVASGERSATC